MSTTSYTDDDVSALAARFEGADAETIVSWAADTFGAGLCAASSMADTALVDLVARIAPSTEVVFLDTQYHFAETLATLDAVRARYPIPVRVMTPSVEPDERWRHDTDGCCHVRKVEPLERALAGRTAWLTGVRRADSNVRADIPVVQRDRRGLVKVNPLATWSDAQLDAYFAAHQVPTHPLLAQGYPSIGCWPCTRKPEAGESARAGRWAGQDKTECGLHL